jgi:hypothetical protein
MVQKIDSDPAVHQAITRIDYLVVPNWYYLSPSTVQANPTLMEARKHAVAAASFGSVVSGILVSTDRPVYRRRD